VTAAAPALDGTRLARAYKALLDAYGPQEWWPIAGPPETASIEVCVGAILVQHARWESAAEAVARLRDAGALSVEAFATLPLADIEGLIRGAGTFRSKARTLRAFAEHVRDTPGGTIEDFLDADGETVRRRCLDVWGVGPETADAIVLYAAGRPTFVVDAYARRLFARLACALPDRYDPARRALLDATGAGVARLGEWHALIVAHGKARCRARAPLCEGCPLRAMCPAGAGSLAP
jgi:endonuclease-3 related protein